MNKVAEKQINNHKTALCNIDSVINWFSKKVAKNEIRLLKKRSGLLKISMVANSLNGYLNKSNYKEFDMWDENILIEQRIKILEAIYNL
jgi:hypothetical protein